MAWNPAAVATSSAPPTGPSAVACARLRSLVTVVWSPLYAAVRSFRAAASAGIVGVPGRTIATAGVPAWGRGCSKLLTHHHFKYSRIRICHTDTRYMDF